MDGLTAVVVGGLLAAGGGGLIALLDARARHAQWQRERAEDERRFGAAAVADAELALEHANSDVLALWGDDIVVQARIDELLRHQRTAHESLTRLRVRHPDPAVRDAAADARRTVVAACNDAAMFASSVRGGEPGPVSLEAAKQSREDAGEAVELVVRRLGT